MRLPPGWRTITREGRNEPEQGVPSPELVAQNTLKERPLSLQIRFRCKSVRTSEFELFDTSNSRVVGKPEIEIFVSLGETTGAI